MLAARTFNQNAGSITPRLYGSTTNGWQWQFLRLDGETLSIDRHPLPLEPLGRLLGVLLHILREVAPR